MQRLVQDMRRLERTTSVYSGFCVVVLLVCASFTVQSLLIRITPHWNLSYLPWLAGFAAAEALISQRYIMRPSHLSTNGGIYRIAELLLIFLVTRLVTIPWQRGLDLWQIILDWKDNPLENFFDAQFLLALLVVVMIWGLSMLFAQDLAEQEGDELAVESTDMEGLVSDRAAVQRRLAGRIFAVGGVLVFINGLLRQDTFYFFGAAEAPKQAMWHVIVYFVAGLVLLSLSQLANRRLAWAWEQIPVKADLPRKWITASIIFLLLVFLIAFTLPTAYSQRFLPGLGNLLGIVFSFLYGLALLILTPIFYLFGWLMSLFKADQTSQDTGPIQLPELFARDVLAPVVPPAWLATLRTILIWVIILGVGSYLLFIYAKQNRQITIHLHRAGVKDWLKKAWQWLVSHFKAGWKRAPALIKAGFLRWRVGAGHRAAEDRSAYLSLRRLDPRRKVIFYYLALLRRTGEMKLPRAGWQTPREYNQILSRHLPEVEQELASMTDLFIEARYSQHAIGDRHINSIQSAWEQVRKLLRSRIRAHTAHKET